MKRLLILIGLICPIICIAQPFHYDAVDQLDQSVKYQNLPYLPIKYDVYKHVETIETDDGNYLSLSLIKYERQYYSFNPDNSYTIISDKADLSLLTKTNANSGEVIWKQIITAGGTVLKPDPATASGMCAIPKSVTTSGDEEYAIAIIGDNYTDGTILQVNNSGMIINQKIILKDAITTTTSYQTESFDVTFNHYHNYIMSLNKTEAGNGKIGVAVNMLFPNTLVEINRLGYGFTDVDLEPDRIMMNPLTNDIFILAHSTSSTEEFLDLVVIRTDKDGGNAFVRRYETNGWLENPNDLEVAINNNNGIVIVGTAKSIYIPGGHIPIYGDNVGFVVELDNNLDLVGNFQYFDFKISIEPEFQPTSFNAVSVDYTKEEYHIAGAVYDVEPNQGVSSYLGLLVDKNLGWKNTSMEPRGIHNTYEFSDVFYDIIKNRFIYTGSYNDQLMIYESYWQCTGEWKVGCSESFVNTQGNYSLDDASTNQNVYGRIASVINSDFLNATAYVERSNHECLSGVEATVDYFEVQSNNSGPGNPFIHQYVTEIIKVLQAPDGNYIVFGTQNLDYKRNGGTVDCDNELAFVTKINRSTKAVIWHSNLENTLPGGPVCGTDRYAQAIALIPGSTESYAVLVTDNTNKSLLFILNHNGTILSDHELDTHLEGAADMVYSPSTGYLNIIGSTELNGINSFAIYQFNLSTLSSITHNAFNLSADIWPTSVLEDAYGNIFIAGHDNSEALGNDVYIAKTNSTGILQWLKKYRTNSYAETAYKLNHSVLPGNIILTGHSEGGVNFTSNSMFLEIDADGDLQQFKNIEISRFPDQYGPAWTASYEIVPDNSCQNSYAVVGRMIDNPLNPTEESFVYLQLSTDFSPLQNRVDMRSPTTYYLSSFVWDNVDGHYATVGQYRQYFHLRTTAENGGGFSGISCGYETPMTVQSITLDSDDPGNLNNVLYTPNTYSVDSYNQRFRPANWVDNDCLWSPVTGSMPFVLSIEESKNIHSIYPNPAKNQINIEFSQPEGQARILSINGKELLSNLQLSAGANQINISTLPIGMYVVEIQTENGISTQKFLKE